LFHQFPTANKSRNIRLSFIIISVVVTIISCTPTKRITKDTESKLLKDSNIIRVLLTESETIKLSFSNDVEIKFDNQSVYSFDKNVATFSLDKDVIRCKVNNKNFYSNKFIIYPINKNFISFNGKSYRGFLTVVYNSSKIYLINHLDIEDYLKGVILKEMPLGNNDENSEAIKAFSIVARTYALKKKLEQKEFFDTYSDTRDQFYGGLDSENNKINKLLEMTKGLLLFYEGKLATVFYHSTCGGKTENVENVFKSEPLPYLESTNDGNKSNCRISPRFEWEESFSEELILKRLAEANYISNINSKLKNIEVVTRFKSNRVNELQITLEENKVQKKISLFSNNIRFVLKNSRGNILPSTNFQIVSRKNGLIIFKGKGFGHGVGMCQWGSIYLSRNGWDYKKIIEFYFPKTEIRKL
jgi:stage II sporulation protein D